MANISIRLNSEPLIPSEFEDKLISDTMDIYFWYEGSHNLPVRGATFMQNKFLIPILTRKEFTGKIYLYCLKEWNFNRTVTEMKPSPIVDMINSMSMVQVEAISSATFFQYCSQVTPGTEVYNYINRELPRKEWLINISKNNSCKGVIIDQVFNYSPSLLDFIRQDDVALAYSSMQYIEGYFLIRESILRHLKKGSRKIHIGFVLPNDESRYYQDYPIDIPCLLAIEFGSELNMIEISIEYYFFKYGDSISARPYIDKTSKSKVVNPDEIHSYFSFLIPNRFLSQSRVDIHRLY